MSLENTTKLITYAKIKLQKEGLEMNPTEALELLKKHEVTNNMKMLRHWIRKGEIIATLTSSKQGYIINESSLKEFIKFKEEKKEQMKILDEEILTEYYNRGYDQGKAYASLKIKEREKELILKDCYEQEISFTIVDLEKNKRISRRVIDFFRMLGTEIVSIKILGDWALIDETRDLIDISLLPYPNRQLKTRLRDAFLDLTADSLKNEMEYTKTKPET